MQRIYGPQFTESTLDRLDRFVVYLAASLAGSQHRRTLAPGRHPLPGGFTQAAAHSNRQAPIVGVPERGWGSHSPTDGRRKGIPAGDDLQA